MFITKILIDTFKYGVENRTNIFESLKYPGLGIIITSLFGKNDSDALAIQGVLLLLINGYFFIIFAINCHRLFLEKKVPNGVLEILKWNKRNTNFLFASFALAILMVVSIFPIVFILLEVFYGSSNQMYFYVVTSIVLLPTGCAFARISLILPATAIDMDNSWSTAWAMSKGYGWSLCFLVIIFPILAGFVIDAIGSTSIVAKLLTTILSVAVTFYEISILSYSYKVLKIKEKATQGAVGGLA